ncbi:MAG: hypothetical protein GXP39_16805 [Chloroflexi bacterium]|nr:hypothetical protein [Chloroflexota bacterium]
MRYAAAAITIAILLVGTLTMAVFGQDASTSLQPGIARIRPLQANIQQRIPISLAMLVPIGPSATRTITLPVTLELNLRIILTNTTAAITKTSPHKTKAISETQPAACPGGCITQPDPSCDIKGNVNPRSETKIYHTSTSRWYSRTKIRPEEGDRWFCTEEEAQEAGFRPPKK